MRIAIILLLVLSWTVPVAAEVTATRSLTKGTVLRTEMLSEREGSAEVQSLVGHQLTRPIFKGKRITADDVKAPDVVFRQSPVVVRFRRGGLLLTVPGRSLKNGTYGEVVPVLIENKRSPISARIVGDGVVEL